MTNHLPLLTYTMTTQNYFILAMYLFIVGILTLAIGEIQKIPKPSIVVLLITKSFEKTINTFLSNRYLVPVKIISNVIWVKTKKMQRVEALFGRFLLYIVCLIFFCASLLFLWGGYWITPYIFHVINIFILFQCLSYKRFVQKLYLVFQNLDDRDLFSARKNLSLILERPTQDFTETKILSSSVESIAQKIVQGFVAPIFYVSIGLFVLGPLPFLMIYTCIHTISFYMSHETPQNQFIRRPIMSAQRFLDYIPSKLCVILVFIAAWVLRFDYKGVLRVHKRDQNKYIPFNGHYPIAAITGALQISFLVNKNQNISIGDEGKVLMKNDLLDAVKLMLFTFFVSVCMYTILGVSIGVWKMF